MRQQHSFSRMGMLLGVLSALGLIALGVPDRVLTHISYASERGRIQAAGEELARLEAVSHAFRLVANVARPGVVQIQVRGGDSDREEFARIDREYLDARAELNELERRRDDEQTDAAERRALRREIMDLRLRLQLLEAERNRILDRMHQGAGSGIVLDEAGHILTNNHVVEDRSDIRVRLHDHREFQARLVGTDPKTDLAVIRIEAAGLHPLSFGDSDQAEVGDWVIAVGAPFGLTHTVTHGIISAKGRTDINAPGSRILYQDFIQTDAAINPGNSGGPLLNLRAEVIGVNTAIATTIGAYNAGIAFTIPSNMARKISRHLIESGQVARGWLGIQLAELAPGDAELFRLGEQRGVMVDVIYEGSAAQRAGLDCEDVIVAVNGEGVTEVNSLRGAIANILPGERVQLEIIRDGQPTTIVVALDRQPDDITAWVRQAGAVRGRNVEPLPLALRSLRSDEAALLARKWSLPDLHGVLVLEVQPGPESVTSPLRAAEIVVAVNGRSVRTVSDLADMLDERPADGGIELSLIASGGEKRTVTIRP